MEDLRKKAARKTRPWWNSVNPAPLYHLVVVHLAFQATLSHLMVDLTSESYMGKPQGKGT